MVFKDRFDAAHQLVVKLEKYKGKNAIILAVPRGGLQIGSVLAEELGLPLDVALTKKIGAPGNPEYAIGAVSLTGEVLEDVEGIPDDYIQQEIKEIRKSLKERYKAYTGRAKPPSLKGKIAIITDDGIATGRTLLATIEMIRKENPDKIVIAVPVGPKDSIRTMQDHADEVICLFTPSPFFAIGMFYQNFDQVDDEEAIRLLKEANK